MWDITGMAVRWNLKRTYIPEPNIAWRRVYINREIFKRSSSEVFPTLALSPPYLIS